MNRVFVRYATAGGRTVDLYTHYEKGLAVGVCGRCTGCSTELGPRGETLGPLGEAAARDWAHQHAINCTSRP